MHQPSGGGREGDPQLAGKTRDVDEVGLTRFALGVLMAMVSVMAVAPPARADDEPVVDERPDIIVIMVDDLGAIDDRILERLPAISDLFLGARRFDAAYSETPLCCPGRAAFLTGQHTAHHGVTYNDARLLNPDYTIATALHDAGYTTGMFGKYLNLAPRLLDKSPPGWDKVVMSTSNSDVESIFTVDDVEVLAGHRDRYTAMTAVEWLASLDVSVPAFMYANSHAPHSAFATGEDGLPTIEPLHVEDTTCDGIEPWRPPDYNYPSRPDGWPLGEICKSMLTVDDMVRELRAAVEVRGRPTTWVFMSDNGMSWGRDGFPAKRVPNAGQFPLMFAGAGIEPGRTNALVSNIDISPTLADIAGAEMAWADGRSFRALLSGGSFGRRCVFENFPVAAELTGGPWTSTWKGIRTPNWHALKIGKQKWRLYDLRVDPYEYKNLAARRGGWLRTLRALQPCDAL